MSGVESSNDRLSKCEFAELIQHLPVQEMFLIEYLMNGSWHKLFFRKSVSINPLNCHLCNTEVSGFKNLLTHINGRKHLHFMESVADLYHPEYTNPKYKVTGQSGTSLASNKDNKTTNKKKKQDIVATKAVEVTTAKNKEQNGSKAKNEKVPEKVPSKTESTGKNIVTTNADEITTARNKDQNESNAKKEKVPEKMPTNTESTDKATKLVKNPIAFRNSELSNKPENIAKDQIASTVIVIDDGPEDKPQYQTDKIIIPTMNKNRSLQDDQASREKDSPLFSTKTYSSKPCDDDIHGILGVEYVIKLINKNNESSPRYECGLCELVLDAFAMQRHLEGYNHRMKFCEKHFPTAIRHYRQYMQDIPEHDLFKVMTPVLAKLAVAIEKHHGRNLPYECYESDFTLHRHDILAKAYSCRHASEQYGPTFTHVIDSKEIDKYINERHKYAPPTFSRSAIFDSKLGKDNDLRGSSQLNGRSGSAKISIPKDRHRHVIRDNNKTLVDAVPRTNKISKSFNTQFMPSNNFIDYSMPNPMDVENMMFRKSFQPPNMMESFMPTSGTNNFPSNNMMERFIPNSGYNYNMQPQTNFAPCKEQGPSVDDQKYNNMVDEFLRGTLKGIHGNTSRKRSTHSSQSSGPLPKRSYIEDLQQSHDVRVVEQEIATLDAEFKKYRQDPETYSHYNDEWQKFWKRRKDELIAAGKDHRNYNYQPEWVKFIKERIENVYREKLESIKSKSQKDNVKHPSYNSATGSNNAATNKPHMTDNKFNPEADHSQVVSVLRLMAALEENLGSLGPKIITLLSKALQLEKTNRGEFSNSLLNDENCSVIETAKEKFKGLLITGIVEGSKQRAMKKAVEEAESLLTSTQQHRALNHTQKVSANISEPKRKSQVQPVPTIADILKLLRAHSDYK